MVLIDVSILDKFKHIYIRYMCALTTRDVRVAFTLVWISTYIYVCSMYEREVNVNVNYGEEP